MSTKVAMQPREPSSTSHQLCSQIFPDSALKSDPAEFTYSTTNDYGKKIHKLLFCKPKEGFSSHFFENIKEIGAIEGFEVVPSPTTHCCRDPKLRASDNKILQSACGDNIYKAIGRCKKRAEYLKNHSSVCTEHPSFNKIMLGLVALADLQRLADEGTDKKNLRISRLYVEGGDTLHLTNKNGVSQYIIGEDLAIITHQQLRMNKWFDDPSKNEENVMAEAAIFSKYADTITMPYISGDTFKKVQAQGKEIKQGLSDDETLATLKEMNHMGLLTKLRFTTEEQKTKGRELASEYLAQAEYVKERIFPVELRCDAEKVIFSPQVAYHIDLAMAPGPKGSIFLQDYEASVRLAEAIKAKSQELDLSREDLEHLDSFIETTKKVGKDLKPLFEEAKKRLEAAGYTVISIPAAFYSYRKDKPFNINFLNCITGYSEKTGHFYVIAPGTKTEGKLADLLMDSFVEFLRSQCNNVVVYFAGRDPNNARDFAEAVTTANNENQLLGPHCLSFELETSAHKTKVT